MLTLAEILGQAHTAGWRLAHLSTTDQREWNEFETSCAVGPKESPSAYLNDEPAPSVRDTLDANLSEYVNTYRSVLGCC